MCGQESLCGETLPHLGNLWPAGTTEGTFSGGWQAPGCCVLSLCQAARDREEPQNLAPLLGKLLLSLAPQISRTFLSIGMQLPCGSWCGYATAQVTESKVDDKGGLDQEMPKVPVPEGRAGSRACCMCEVCRELMCSPAKAELGCGERVAGGGCAP